MPFLAMNGRRSLLRRILLGGLDRDPWSLVVSKQSRGYFSFSRPGPCLNTSITLIATTT